MEAGYPFNIAIFEVRMANGNPATCKGFSHDDNDEAIRLAYEMIIDQGRSGEHVTEIYTEWEPSLEMHKFIARKCPNARVTWSFEVGDEEEFRKKMNQIYGKKWWQFWK